jgi:hypothetical protein
MSVTDTRVAQDLVHRANEREILVSPPWRATEGTYGSATVTTDIAPYYLDHPTTHLADLVLMTEACRQAALSAAHAFEGLSRDIAFFFNSIEVEVTDVDALIRAGQELAITTAIRQMKLRGNGSPKQIVYSQQVAAGSRDPVVRTLMAVQGVLKSQYADLRTYQRDGSPPPTTAGLRTGTRRVEPGLYASVGRTQTANVVLADLRIAQRGATATLAPDFGNPSMFDHDYDHYPAMVLIEAGRQLALASMPRPSDWIASGIRAEFPHFAELDVPTSIVARHAGRRVEVRCRQGDTVTTDMSFQLARIAGEA